MLSTCATAAVAVAFAVFAQWENQRFDRTRGLLNSGEKSLRVIQAFRSLALHPEPGSRILLRPEKRFYLNDYYPLFVASLVWNDHSLQIYVEGQPQLSQHQVAKVDCVVSFNEFQAKLVPAPDHS